MALPYGTTGSLGPGFPPDRDVSLTVKLPYVVTLYGWFPISLREPSCASVTVLEATAPVKLPARQCSRPGLQVWVRILSSSGWYFKVGSTPASAGASKPPTYPTQMDPKLSAKL